MQDQHRKTSCNCEGNELNTTNYSIKNSTAKYEIELWIVERQNYPSWSTPPPPPVSS